MLFLKKMKTKNIISKKNHPSLLELKKIITSTIKKRIPQFNNRLDLLHKFVDDKNINKLRIEIFTKLNKTHWEDIVLKLCGNEICQLLGSDLLIQSKINVSIQMPDDERSLLPAHSDSWSADSPFQINLWIPLTNAFGTNSMFIWNESRTMNVMEKIKKDKTNMFDLSNLKSKDKDFIKLSFGQVLIFNPALIHGNVINKTKKTRVSLNVRLKSIFSPEPNTRNPDRRFGTYYKHLKISDNTNFAIKVLRSGVLD